MPLEFEILATDGAARRGRLTTPHGVVETPAFAPVGTQGAVKGLGPLDLESLGAQLMLSNLYHLALRPGIDRLEALGGLHRFAGWERPILTDSGGYQVFSLARLRTIDDEGVTFRSHLDGDEVRFTPAWVARAQARLGVDLAMMLDECPPWPVSEEEAGEALDRTLAWAERGRAAWDGEGGFFGIVQGSVFSFLRQRAVDALAELEFDGYAIGGVSVGEPPALRRRVVEETAPLLPTDKPRYLMGVGRPEDILHAVRQGVDLFDCVLPTRNARHGQLLTAGGVLRIKNARFRDDDRPLDSDCPCPVCARLSRATLNHLYRIGEITAQVLGTVHNLRVYLDFMQDLRDATSSGTLARLERRDARREVGREAAGGSETVPQERPQEAAVSPPSQDPVPRQ
ncbi:MAG: tRNA guanosine(34) transglycosylase Tgt [Thermoanaerobaculia bacterium]|nr:tRNA guanosine(34) transglycosylase Tgt [Thermoanaerobaculia bacterium]